MFRRRAAALLLCSVALAGCASARASAPDWKPQPNSTLEPGQGPGVTPSNPEAVRPSSGSGGGAQSPGSTSSGTSSADPNVVAKNLTAPVGLAVLPDGTALVGERTTGRIVLVQPQPGQPVTVIRTLPGLDVSGDGGLLDLALSPKYTEDGLVYAYITTPTDNRVVEFTLAGPITSVIAGIPHGTTGNEGRIAFDQAGDLLVGTGDAGQPALAADPSSLAGKVLRLTPAGAPIGATPVFTSGHHDTAGLCIEPDTGAAVQIERGAPGTSDEVNVLAQGASYGWPAVAPGSVAATATVGTSEQGLGGCAVANGALYVTSLDGQELLSATYTAQGAIKLGTFTDLLTGAYGRLTTVVAASDGTLWLTTSNKDGAGKPVPDDERVLHIQQPASTGGGSKA
jgi:glucose/arabinose dehydrogenase